jgi:RHS repeat-associated protein
MVTKADGTVHKNHDYLPFGDEIGSGTAGRDTTFPGSQYPHSPTGQSLEFTSKERDAETGLDYFGARYMSSAQGRFTSPHRWAGLLSFEKVVSVKFCKMIWARWTR